MMGSDGGSSSGGDKPFAGSSSNSAGDRPIAGSESGGSANGGQAAGGSASGGSANAGAASAGTASGGQAGAGTSAGGTTSGGSGGSTVGNGGSSTSAGNCQQDSDCIMCPYDKSPAEAKACYCLTCSDTPMSKAQCDQNHAAWDKVCENVALPCPAIKCLPPPEVSCVNHECVAK